MAKSNTLPPPGPLNQEDIETNSTPKHFRQEVTRSEALRMLLAEQNGEEATGLGQPDAAREGDLTIPPAPEAPRPVQPTRRKAKLDKFGVPEGEKAERIPQSFYFPDYLDKALLIDTVNQRKSKNLIILEALRTAGYQIRDEDMFDGRRDRKSKKSAEK